MGWEIRCVGEENLTGNGITRVLTVAAITALHMQSAPERAPPATPSASD